jgi:hypothetical protein
MPTVLSPEAQSAAVELQGSPRGVAKTPKAYFASQTPFALAIFLSAFLLFQVQLLLGKQILPIFGGAPAVWTSCLLVFQLLLLAGYAFAHVIAVKLSPRGQAVIQLTLLGTSLALLALLSRVWPTPITPGAGWRPAADADPTWLIVRFLLAAIGLPFFLLSTTSPLAQHWFAKAAPGQSPYRLYALSNAGSMLGLLSYPILVEPNLRLHVQGWLWTACYLAYAITFGVCAVLGRRTSGDALKEKAADLALEREPRPGWAQSVLWITFALCASVLLLASTNFICQEVAVIPFLWVLPLCLYLLSFILCFESDRWYRREIFHPLFAVAAGAVILVMLPNANYSYMGQLAACSALLLTGCMVCHGEAARTRPPAAHLTQFYLCIAGGGALGGIFVSLIAPRIFPNYWEYPLGILGCAALILFVAMDDDSSWWHTGRASLAVAMLGGVALLAPSVLAPVWPPAAQFPVWARWTIASALFLLAAWLYLRERRAGLRKARPWPIRLAARMCLALLTAGLAIPQKAEFFHVVARARNFYGVLSVVEVQRENYLALRHGKIVHGFQFQDPRRARLATGYFGENSPANIMIRNWPRHPMRVGLVGMGAGTLAAIGQPGDVYRFYEINPDVYRWSSGSQPYFTFLEDSPARIEVVLGDARISLEREAARGEFQKFDVLVMDAFSSDAIPMHLLTREAFEVFAQHLRGPESVIAVHISNNTLDLSPVVAALAKEFGMAAVRGTTLSLKSYLWTSDWILLAHNAASLDVAELKPQEIPFPAGKKPILWTDDYSNLWRVLR